MSVDVNSSLPPWKQAILDRKRRAEEDDKRKTQEENERLSQMPSWKRDILLKKQKVQKTKGHSYFYSNNDEVGNTNGPLSIVVTADTTCSQPSPASPKMPDGQLSPRRRSSDHEVDGIHDDVTARDRAPSESVQQQPWFKSKLRSPPPKDDSSPNLMPSPTNLRHSDGAQSNSTDFLKPEDDDDVFADGGEVPYGRGFVHKLLKRFRHISAQTDTGNNILPRKSTSPNRLPSADTLTDAKYRKSTSQKPSVYHYPEKPTTNLSRNKAVSMDNIHMEFNVVASAPLSPSTMNKQNSKSMENIFSDDASTDAHDDVVRSSTESTEDEMPRHRIVSMTRDVFESISTPVNFTYNKPLSPGQKSVKPEKKTVSEKKTVPAAKSDIVDGNSSLNRRSDSSQPKDDEALPEQEEIIEEPSTIEVKIEEKKSSVSSVKAPGKSWYFSGKDTSQKSVSNRHTPLVSNGDQNANYASKTNMNGSLRSGRIESIQPKIPAVNKTKSEVTPVENSRQDVLKQKDEVLDNFGDAGDIKQTETTSVKSDADEKPVVSSVVKSAEPTTNHYINTDKPTREIEKVHDLKKPDLNKLNLNLEKLPPKTSAPEREPAAKKNQTPSTQNRSSRPSNSVKAQNKINKARTTGPGSMLMRPASNLVVGTTKSEFLQLTKFNDVKTGEFAPASKRPGYYDTYSDSEDEEVDNVPVTNIDDCLSTDHTELREGDANPTKQKSSKWDFTGAGVSVGKSSLKKSANRKMLAITFSGQSTTYEYPSEQTLLDSMPPQPGDYDHPDTLRMEGTVSPDIDDMPDPEQPITSLKSATTKLASDTLSSYRSKSAGDYQLGVDSYQAPMEQKPDPPVTAPTETPAPPEEDSTWSESSSADLLF